MTTVAFIGLGNMGRPMAANIRRHGFTVIAYDLNAEAAHRWANDNDATSEADLAALGAAADFIVTMLPTGREVRQCVEAMQSVVRPGTIVIDMSSADPVGTRTLAQEFAALGVHLIDAPVSGGVPRAIDGTLAIMIGSDDPDAVDRAEPVLKCMGDRLFRVGGSGNGHAMKCLNNFVAGSAFVAASEALIVGDRFGLDRQTMIDVMNVSTARCFNTELVMGQQVVSGNFASGFALGLLAKDVGIAAGLAEAMQQSTPLADLVTAQLADARDRVGETKDHTLAYQVWEGRTRS